MFGRECIWLTGAKGQLGQAILRQIKAQNELTVVLATDQDVDITDMTETNVSEVKKAPEIVDMSTVRKEINKSTENSQGEKQTGMFKYLKIIILLIM